MTERSVLLISADPGVTAAVKESLSPEISLLLTDAAEAVAKVQNSAPRIIIIDHETSGVDGLDLFRRLHALAPKTRTIMLSSGNDIPLAVRAAKSGIQEFLKKPLEKETLRAILDLNLLERPEALPLAVGEYWLQGESQALHDFYAAVRKFVFSGTNLLLAGEPGIDKAAVANLIHRQGATSRRAWRTIDLAAFDREESETFFWSTVQELMAESGPDSVQGEEEKCGTLFLDNLAAIPAGFRSNLLSYLLERKGKLDKKITAIVGVDPRRLTPEVSAGFELITIPSLRERRTDLPLLLASRLRHFAVVHGKPVSGLSGEVLLFLQNYSFPGNYRELETLLEVAVLRASGPQIGLGELPVDYALLAAAVIAQVFRTGRLTLDEARKEFGGGLGRVLLSKLEDPKEAARFMGVSAEKLLELAAASAGELGD
jgi:DNA-binding NtrC family response regulator